MLLVCPGGLGVGWRGVAGPGPWSGRRALLPGALAGPLTCLGLPGQVGVGGGWTPLSLPGRRGAGVPAMRLSEECLEGSDVGALVRRVHPCGGGLVGGGQVGVPKGRPALPGPQLRGLGGVFRVGECGEWLRCSFGSADGGVEPAASDSEVGCYLLWCRVHPGFWPRGCCLGGRELWVWEV